MKYRKFEKLGVETSLLGFGCMRFPTNAEGKIDRVRAEKMLDEAIANGVNYIDTAYPYHEGESELFVGEVLKKYPRDSFYLATKMPLFSQMQNENDKERLFNEQLNKLQVDYVDFYLIHCVTKEAWEEKVLKFGVLDYLIEMKKQGKIKYLGFSFHDDYEVFETVLNAYDWDFCQIQYNYMDTDVQAGDKGYELTVKKNIPLVIMEPIKGGSLANLPEDITNIFKEYNDASASSWALRWVATHENVKVILSGMSTEEHVQDNLNTFNLERVELNEEELKIVDKVKQAILARTKNGCTGCSYCMPCPFGVNIPKNFSLWNKASMYGEITQRDKGRYAHLNEEQASQCKQCGKCETLCPQHIQIREDLKRVHQDLGE